MCFGRGGEPNMPKAMGMKGSGVDKPKPPPQIIPRRGGGSSYNEEEEEDAPDRKRKRRGSSSTRGTNPYRTSSLTIGSGTPSSSTRSGGVEI